MSSGQHDLLQILNAHGQQFLSSFGSLPQPSSTKRKRQPDSRPLDNRSDSSAEEGEWGGIQDQSSDLSDSDWDENAEYDDVPVTGSVRPSDVVVFTDTTSKSSQKLINKAQAKDFMSSKVSKISKGGPPPSRGKEKDEGSDEDIERTNAENDGLLHRLIHTKLLSGSLNPELDLTPAQRKKALAGRVLELAGAARLGKGEKIVRTTERKRAAKRVRDGLLAKQKHVEEQKLEEAKNLGNYHPAVKQLYNTLSLPGKKRRDRGLKMGVGKFKGGFLDLSKERRMMERAPTGGRAPKRMKVTTGRVK
ncbi:hypothetical protein AX16_010297 [Volvariella volvacea WC 439]|nr:hypothetical protein AX16_010297 [Volvariella volvacea WC 439]